MVDKRDRPSPVEMPKEFRGLKDSRIITEPFKDTEEGLVNLSENLDGFFEEFIQSIDPEKTFLFDNIAELSAKPSNFELERFGEISGKELRERISSSWEGSSFSDLEIKRVVFKVLEHNDMLTDGNLKLFVARYITHGFLLRTEELMGMGDTFNKNVDRGKLDQGRAEWLIGQLVDQCQTSSGSRINVLALLADKGFNDHNRARVMVMKDRKLGRMMALKYFTSPGYEPVIKGALIDDPVLETEEYGDFIKDRGFYRYVEQKLESGEWSL